MNVQGEIGRARWSRRRWQVAAILAAVWAVGATLLAVGVLNEGWRMEAELGAWRARALAAEAPLAGKSAPAPVTPEVPKGYNF